MLCRKEKQKRCGELHKEPKLLITKKEPIRVHIAKENKIKRKSNFDDHSHPNKKDTDDVIFMVFIEAPKSSS